MIIIRWFLSKAVREAVAMKRHVWKLLQHQRDILKPDEVEQIESALAEVKRSLAEGNPKPILKTFTMRLEAAANENLRPYPSPGWRENVEVLLVALAVAMGIRTFFLQPFKIPTGSMQPTLFGVNSVPDFSRINFRSVDQAEMQARYREQMELQNAIEIPTGLARIRDWFAGNSYVHFVAKTDGVLNRIDPPFRLLIFNIKQTLWFAGKAHTIWFPPDYGALTLEQRAGARIGGQYRAGQDVIKLQVTSGDHLFVDRVTYNFRPPERGEIIVFETRGIYDLPQDQFYIKRLVGLGGETVQIGNNRHLIINGTNRLDAATPHFEFVYGFDPKYPPQDSHYSGHVNQLVASLAGFPYEIAQLFRDQNSAYDIPADRFMVMGDNTMNSKDSREWGSFSADNVIGRSCFVYWPLSSRFGWANLVH